MATTITANGINFPDGSAGSPSIGGSDTNTGLFTGSDIVGFATGGSERLKIDASGNVNIANDSGKLRLGASNDLQIYHDGSQSYVANSTGNLNISSGAAITLKTNTSEAAVICNNNGSVDLYYNNSKKFETTSAGATLTGDLTITDDLFLQDNLLMGDGDKIAMGDGEDLQIYHDGSSSYIADNSNQLYIRANAAIKFENDAGSETFAKFHENGNCELYHNNSKKLETTSGGIEVSGGANFTSGNVSLNDNSKIKLGNADDLQIYHDGGDSIIKDAGTGGIRIDTSQILIRNADGTQYIMQGSHNGDTALYQSGNYRAATRSWGFQVNGVLAPEGDNTHDIGFSTERWDDIYATNGTIQTSDKNEKNTITASDLGLSFVNKLKPVFYKFNNKTRTHYGLIAQDVEATLSDINKPTSDFAGFIKEDIPDKLYVENDDIPEGKSVGDVKTAAFTTYGLRYHEFISPLIKAVQELSAQVETLKTEVAALKTS